MSEKLNIGIILGSTRQGRVSPQVGEWVLKQAASNDRANFEIVDVKDYALPLLGESEDTKGVEQWNKKLNSLDGFIFVVAEYNHSLPASLKNAFDSAREAWWHKAAGIVSYGSAGGTRAAEHVRGILGELNIADVRAHVFFSLFNDFEKMKTFTPQDVHKEPLQGLFNQVIDWAGALKPLRK